MAIYIGNQKIKDIYFGSQKIKEVYHGADLVWSGKKTSYAILTNGTRADFELENTPIYNFQGTSYSITLNGISHQKTTIKKLVFGDSYSVVTGISIYFLRYCSALTSLDLSAFSNVTSIGGNFLRDCPALTQFKIGAVNVPQTSTSGFLQNTTAITTILVPMQSVQAYKTTEPWLSHSSKITGY